MFPSLAHIVLGQKGSRHDVAAEFERNLNRRGPLDKQWIFCPNKFCKQHLSFKLSSNCLILKCPICLQKFNPYRNIIITCKKCKTKNATPLYNQIIQCANKDCKLIINCWPVFRIEKYSDQLIDNKKKKNDNTIVIDDDDDDIKNNNNNNDQDDDIKMIDQSISQSQAQNEPKIEPKEERFLMVREQNIFDYKNKKKKKLHCDQKIIRMENDNGLVVIINNNQYYKGKQITIKEPVMCKSPFEWYFSMNIDEWSDKYKNDSKLQLLLKIKKYWNNDETEQEKLIYATMAKNDKQRYKREMKLWQNIKWMNDKPYISNITNNNVVS